MKKIEVFGTGCPKCKKLYEAAESVAKDLGIEYEISKVQEIKEIARRGVTMTPALAVDGRVVSSGSIPSAEKIRGYLVD